MLVFFHFQTTVVYSNYSAGRDEAFFANAETFIPERWSEEGQQSPSQPFGFGQRSCYGKCCSGGDPYCPI